MRKLILVILAILAIPPLMATYLVYVALHPWRVPDPSTDRLTIGTEVIACPDTNFPDSTSVCVRGLPSGSSILGNWDLVPIGTKFRVISDEAECDTEGTGEAKGPDEVSRTVRVALRSVKIIVLEGEHRNQPGVVNRNYIRAVPR